MGGRRSNSGDSAPGFGAENADVPAEEVANGSSKLARDGGPKRDSGRVMRDATERAIGGGNAAGLPAAAAPVVAAASAAAVMSGLPVNSSNDNAAEPFMGLRKKRRRLGGGGGGGFDGFAAKHPPAARPSPAGREKK